MVMLFISAVLFNFGSVDENFREPKSESVDWASGISFSNEKIAFDLEVFSTDEFNVFNRDTRRRFPNAPRLLVRNWREISSAMNSSPRQIQRFSGGVFVKKIRHDVFVLRVKPTLVVEGNIMVQAKTDCVMLLKGKELLVVENPIPGIVFN